METNLTVDELAPYAKAAQGPLVMWPAVGAMAALFFASFHFDSPALKGIAITLYILGVFGAVAMQIHKSGVQPSFRRMPNALRSNLYRFWVLSAVLAVGALAVAFGTNFLIGGLIVGVGMTVAGLSYHLRARSIVATLQAGV